MKYVIVRKPTHPPSTSKFFTGRGLRSVSDWLSGERGPWTYRAYRAKRYGTLADAEKKAFSLSVKELESPFRFFVVDVLEAERIEKKRL